MFGKQSARLVVVILLCLAAGYFARNYIKASGGRADRVPKIAFVTALGSGDDFWKIVIAGAKDAAKDYKSDLTILEPTDSEYESQTSIISSLDPAELDGVAVSPTSPTDQTRMLSRLATQTYLVTYDNDAPLSLRHCYVGTNNTSAGRLCGRLVKEALPEGGQVAVFIGDLARDNARLRRNGLIETLLGGYEGKPVDEYPADQPVSGGGFVIVKTYVDGSNPTKAKENAAAALKEYPEIDGLIGLYGYNGPAILDAVTEAGKIGKVKIIAFDEFEKTLQGVADGAIHATVIQDPYQYGYESVRMLHSLSSKTFQADEIMGRGSLFLPCDALRKDDVAKYRKKLASRLNAAST
jgi:ribose transport system substrate-binding protein